MASESVKRFSHQFLDELSTLVTTDSLYFICTVFSFSLFGLPLACIMPERAGKGRISISQFLLFAEFRLKKEKQRGK